MGKDDGGNKKTMQERQKWLRLDMENGWQVVVPEKDIRPHGFPKDGKETELADFNCPCKPQIHKDKIIIHNSFEDMERIEKSMKSLLTSKDNQEK